MLRKFRRSLNNQHERDDWVAEQIAQLSPGIRLLDAGCGSQRYRAQCAKLDYVGQDFAEAKDYEYGDLHIKSDVWDIPAEARSFDAVLCTEVLEHVPYPIETIKEFSRLLRPGGALILTAPFACLRHMDPHFFSTGFSDHWYRKILGENGFEIKEITPVGDYYSWLKVELIRTARTGGEIEKLIKMALMAPAVIYLHTQGKTDESVRLLCMGYHVLAERA